MPTLLIPVGRATEQVGGRQRIVHRGYRESHWYVRGLRVGLRNLLKTGFRIGIKRTLGKILQPVNSYTRFPEYELFHRWIEGTLNTDDRDRTLPRLLDLGSPKLFGLLEAEVLPVWLISSDISRTNLEPYLVIEESGAPRREGRVSFCQLDGRRLPFGDGAFDLVFAMSVIEHIEGDGQDSAALQELARVLSPGGLLLASVPYGSWQVMQRIRGRLHGVEPVSDGALHFFQRIYDNAGVEADLLAPLEGRATLRDARTVYRGPSRWARRVHRMRAWLGQDLNGMLGWLNPVLSAWLNRDVPGLVTRDDSYTDVVSLADVYSDIILVWEKVRDQRSSRPPLQRESTTGPGF